MFCLNFVKNLLQICKIYGSFVVLNLKITNLVAAFDLRTQKRAESNFYSLDMDLFIAQNYQSLQISKNDRFSSLPVNFSAFLRTS